MKRYWDEFYSLNGIPTCTCEITDKLLEIDGSSKLKKFLMKLNDDFESIMNQILFMNPRTNINNSYYIVQEVEK